MIKIPDDGMKKKERKPTCCKSEPIWPDASGEAGSGAGQRSVKTD